MEKKENDKHIKRMADLLLKGATLTDLACPVCGSPLFRLKEIDLHTFRHWKATMEYHKTRDILHVQQVLGHRDRRNTLIYINLEKALFQNADDEFHVKVAQNLDEACKLLEVGFEHVAEIDGAQVFRKRK